MATYQLHSRPSARAYWAPTLLLSAILVCCSGCAGMSHWMHNYMCSPHTCPDCQRMHVGAPGVPDPTLPPDAMSRQQPSLPQAPSGVQQQLDDLRDDNQMLREQLTRLDKRSDEQRLDSAQMLQIMTKVADNLRTVGDELDHKRREVEDLEVRVQAQRDRNERALSSVEQELNELLSQIGGDEEASP